MLKIYAIAATVLLVIMSAIALKWKISALIITLFCIEHFRKPTDKEIADYTKKAIGKMFKGD